MRLWKFLIVPFGLVILLSPVGLNWTALAQVDIPTESVEGESNNETASNTTATNSGTEQIILKAEMKPHSNQFMPEGYFEIKKFGFIPSDGSEICPLNNCKYTVEDGQFSSGFGGGYSFSGKLKVTTQEGDVKKSKFYDFNVPLDKTSEEERNGETLQSLEGTFGLGPHISYDITNATMKVDDKNPILTIQGERDKL
jgi:hypothetical protein